MGKPYNEMTPEEQVQFNKSWGGAKDCAGIALDYGDVVLVVKGPHTGNVLVVDDAEGVVRGGEKTGNIKLICYGTAGITGMEKPAFVIPSHHVRAASIPLALRFLDYSEALASFVLALKSEESEVVDG